MQQKDMNYLEWRHFSTDAACLEEIARHRWPGGFLCSRCGHDHAFVLSPGTKTAVCPLPLSSISNCRYDISPYSCAVDQMVCGYPFDSIRQAGPFPRGIRIEACCQRV